MILFFLLYSCIRDGEEIDLTPDTLTLDECLIQTQSQTFEIMTWNVREFPVHDEKTIYLIADIISRENPDLIAFQEITSESDFETLIKKIPGWNGMILPSSNLNPAFLFKLSEVRLIGKAIALFTEDKEDFPRSPLMVSVEHHSGLQLFIINIHLKCCSGEENENRRRRAGERLKTLYR